MIKDNTGCTEAVVKYETGYKTTLIYSGSQAALRALLSYKYTLKVAWVCLQKVLVVARENRLKLIWIPGN